MIFISKKAFNEEVEKRIGEIQFKTRTDEELWRLNDRIKELEFKVTCLEERNRTPVPKVNCECEVGCDGV